MTRALLLTDVVDSTKLAAQLGDVATAALWGRPRRRTATGAPAM